MLLSLKFPGKLAFKSVENAALSFAFLAWDLPSHCQYMGEDVAFVLKFQWVGTFSTKRLENKLCMLEITAVLFIVTAVYQQTFQFPDRSQCLFAVGK